MAKVPLKRHALVDFLRTEPSTGPGSAELVCEVHGQRDYLIVRGSPQQDVFLETTRRHLGQDLPLKANTVDVGPHRIYWLGPTEWLVESRNNLVGVQGRLAVDLTKARAGSSFAGGGYVGLRLVGEAAEGVLRKDCTLDLHLTSFPVGRCAQTGLAKATVLIARPSEDCAFDLLVRSSFADYLARWLQRAGHEYGIRFLAVGP